MSELKRSSPPRCFTLTTLTSNQPEPLREINHMPLEFTPTKSFCYRFARYELLDLIEKKPEALIAKLKRGIRIGLIQKLHTGQR